MSTFRPEFLSSAFWCRLSRKLLLFLKKNTFCLAEIKDAARRCWPHIGLVGEKAGTVHLPRTNRTQNTWTSSSTKEEGVEDYWIKGELYTFIFIWVEGITAQRTHPKVIRSHWFLYNALANTQPDPSSTKLMDFFQVSLYDLIFKGDFPSPHPCRMPFRSGRLVSGDS